MRSGPNRKPNAKAQRRLLLLAAVLVFSATVLFLGCSSDEISSPTPAYDGSDLSSPMMAIPPGQGASGCSEMVISKVIDERTGGIIRNDGVNLIFKPHSLEEDTEITIIRHPSEPDKVLFELLPHGIEFRREVTLTVSMRDSDVGPDEVATIYW